MLIFADIVNQTCPASKTSEQWRASLNRYLVDPAVRTAVGGTNHPNYEEASPRNSWNWRTFASGMLSLRHSLRFSAVVWRAPA